MKKQKTKNTNDENLKSSNDSFVNICVFRHKLLGDSENNIGFLLNALYAPAKSNEYLEWENKTSRELFQRMPKNVNFWWNDLYPISPNKNKQVTTNYFFNGIVTT